MELKLRKGNVDDSAGYTVEQYRDVGRGVTETVAVNGGDRSTSRSIAEDLCDDGGSKVDQLCRVLSVDNDGDVGLGADHGLQNKLYRFTLTKTALRLEKSITQGKVGWQTNLNSKKALAPTTRLTKRSHEEGTGGRPPLPRRLGGSYSFFFFGFDSTSSLRQCHPTLPTLPAPNLDPFSPFPGARARI